MRILSVDRIDAITSTSPSPISLWLCTPPRCSHTLRPADDRVPVPRGRPHLCRRGGHPGGAQDLRAEPGDQQLGPKDDQQEDYLFEDAPASGSRSGKWTDLVIFLLFFLFFGKTTLNKFRDVTSFIFFSRSAGEGDKSLVMVRSTINIAILQTLRQQQRN